jgi:hypothetical protein
MLDNPPNLKTVVQKIRLSRLKLGSLLERFESFEPGQPALEALNNHADSIDFEIDAFVEAACKLMGSTNANP